MFGGRKRIEQLEARIEALVNLVKEYERRVNSVGQLMHAHQVDIDDLIDRVDGIEKREEAIMFPVAKAGG